MPYGVRKEGDKYLVVKKSDGKVLGTHPSHDRAVAQIIAIHTNEKKE